MFPICPFLLTVPLEDDKYPGNYLCSLVKMQNVKWDNDAVVKVLTHGRNSYPSVGASARKNWQIAPMYDIVYWYTLTLVYTHNLGRIEQLHICLS